MLLGVKKRGFGVGRWNGFGGKIKEGEKIEEAARREVKEEIDINLLDIKRVGVLEFSWKSQPNKIEVNVFKVNSFTGEPKESEEMKPQWFDISEIPYEKMWSDDKYWMPLFLAGKSFRGNFVFDDKDEIIEHSLKEVQEA